MDSLSGIAVASDDFPLIIPLAFAVRLFARLVQLVCKRVSTWSYTKSLDATTAERGKWSGAYLVEVPRWI